jgi:hypothetical protein
MTNEEFDSRMRAIDQLLAAHGVSLYVRPLHAWSLLTGKTRLVGPVPPDPARGPYEEPNLIGTITAWYDRYYPAHGHVEGDWGPRLILIRAEVFLAHIPVVYNPEQPPDALKCIKGLSDSLLTALTADERAHIQKRFNTFFLQASDLALCFVAFSTPRKTGLMGELLVAGWADPRCACRSFRPQEASAVLFPMQQATEKYLKAFLVGADAALTDQQLRKRYGHNIRRLLDGCRHVDGAFDQYDPLIKALEFSAEVRYRPPAITLVDALRTVDIAHAICHLVAVRLLKRNI